MWLVAAGDLGGESALVKLGAPEARVVGAVGHDQLEPPPRTPATATQLGHRVDERDQLGDVVGVGARHPPRKRDAGGVD